MCFTGIVHREAPVEIRFNDIRTTRSSGPKERLPTGEAASLRTTGVQSRRPSSSTSVVAHPYCLLPRVLLQMVSRAHSLLDRWEAFSFDIFPDRVLSL